MNLPINNSESKKKRLFSYSPVVDNGVVEEGFTDYPNYMRNKGVTPILLKTKSDCENAYEDIIVNIEDNYDYCNSPKDIKYMNNLINRHYAGSILREFNVMMYQCRRNLLMYIYRYIIEELKEVISPNVFNDLMCNTSDMYTESSFLKRSVFDSGTHILTLPCIYEYNTLFAANQVEEMYYEIYKILGNLLFAGDSCNNGSNNSDIYRIMAEIDGTGIFHNYYEDILNIINILLSKIKNINEYNNIARKELL